ncbi:unnamed protein product [Notodromas monacha]|uniref:Uncharacterized protein n=1 Tax=Notodromas monacha TaxID=399045 RepID=A0A7R9BIE7_9CRUS|nr:unnamed protein product [Notodromas monacha]CAG0914674.1 unnamed protein product [Notodromas monacha]
MRAFLVKLNFGLRDLSFLELGKCGSMQGGVHYDRGEIRERRTTEVYMEWFDVDEHRYKLTCIPMHVHKLEDRVKLGAPCSRQHCLVKIFSIGKALSSGEFVLKPNEKLDPRFCVTVQINRREVFSLHEKGSMFTLKHGDIIEFFLQGIRELTCTIETELEAWLLSEVMLVKQHLTDYFLKIQAMKPGVMFLLTNECSVQVPQTSALLSCPWPVLQKIFQFLTPFETMENLIPMLVVDVRQLWGRGFEFLQSILCSSFESDDWSILKLLEIYPSNRKDFLTALLENRQFCAKLETLVVSCVDCVRLLFRGITGEGSEICFPNVREVTLLCSLQADFSDVDLKLIFPRLLKFIWFQNVRVSPSNPIDHILEMPNVEKLWFRNVHSDTFPESMPLYFFDRRPKEWLENIKLISADQWERVMFLLTNECSVQVPQTSALLSCPWPVLQKIFQFLTPFETMENLIPMLVVDVRQLWGRGFEFLRNILCSSFESDDWRILKLLEIYSSGSDDFVTALLENRQFCAKLETLLVSCVDCVRLLFRGITGEGPEICFPNVREVTLRCCLQAGFSGVDLKLLKFIWFQNVRVSPTNPIDHILEMPSVEKLWFRNVNSDTFAEPMPLYFFDRRPKEWLENIKLISADQWERYIPYSRLINLELVAFFSRDKTTGVIDTDVDGTLPLSLETIFKELRNCSKLKGLILHIPDGFRCAVLNELPRKLEFVAISGASTDEVKSVLECLYPDQTRLEEVWIRVFNTSIRSFLDDGVICLPFSPDSCFSLFQKLGFEENIELLMRFKHLKRVVFVYKPCSPPRRSFDDDDSYDDYYEEECGIMQDQLLRDFEKMLQEFTDKKGCCWKQATLLYEGPRETESLTYSFDLRKKTEFSSFAVTKFFSDWFAYVSDVKEPSEFNAADLISALFPEHQV